MILDYASRGKFDLCFVQETMVSDSNSIKSRSAQWPGVSLWAPALGRKGGVAVFVSPDFEGKIVSWQKDSEGRIISMLIRYQNIDYNVVNIYAPTNVSERKSFLQEVHKYFFPHSKLIMGGDFNCYDNERDKFGGNCSISKELSDFKSCFRLTDAWRVKHPRESQCTWFNSDFSIGSRLDTFLISRDISPGITSCEIRPCVYSDHDFVTVELDCNDGNRHGPGIWKFNNSLLEDDNYCAFIRPIIEQHLSFKHVFISIKEFWESLKITIKDETVKFAKAKRRELSRDKVLITNRLIKSKNQLVSGDSSVKTEICELESLLDSMFVRELSGCKIRSRAQWLEEGEAPTRYFFKLETQRYDKNIITSIYNTNSIEVSAREEIMKAHEEFYAKLFSSEEIDRDVQRDLLLNVTRRLSSADRDLCEGDLALAEATNALKLMSRNKSPGLDGLTAEFYTKFWDLLGPMLIRVFNTCLHDSDLCDSMKSSATRLVFKKGDKKDLKNWRPISLLNVDYKICSKALSMRLSKVLDSIVDPDQTCSVPGRTITSNLALLRDTLDYIERTNETGILISLDQEKAFDRVDRTFLMNLLQHFGFGPSFCNWISTLYHGANMQILVNGWLSDKVNLLRGVRQGDSLSPMLYVLCVEVLACKIRNSPSIEGFLLPGAKGKRFKVSQYADDTTGYLKNFVSLTRLMEAIALYERGTGAKLNRSKSEAMWLGAWKDRDDQPLGLTWVRKMKILGVVFGTINVEKENWEPRLSKLDNILNMWKTRALSFIGKALIVNVLGISKLMHVARVLIPPRWVLDKLNKLIWSFVWGTKIEPVARKALHNPPLRGGIGIIDFEVKSQALRLSAMLISVGDSDCNTFYLSKYFCGSQLARFRPEWTHLRDNSAPSAAIPTGFYSSGLRTLESLSHVTSSFIFSSKNIYLELLKVKTSPPVLPFRWSPFVDTGFDLLQHWSNVRDAFTANYKNDLLWLITLRAVKVRDSLRSWGYIPSDICASCPRKETIDHCFLNCRRVKPVWCFFTALLTSLLCPSSQFLVNCTSIFFFRFPTAPAKNVKIAIFIIKTILYGIWKFRNKATFHNGQENSDAIVKYILQDIKTRIKVDHYRLSTARFRALWTHPSLCQLIGDSQLVFTIN